MHIAFSIVSVMLMLLVIGFGAAALGKRFSVYSVATMAILCVFGVLTGIEAPRIAANLPTPWIGVLERIDIGVFLLWVTVLAATLLRVDNNALGEASGTRTTNTVDAIDRPAA
jgi:hypothetical protein